MRAAAVACLIAACGSTPKAPRSPPKYAQLAARIDELAGEALVRTPTAGMAVAVTWHGGQVVAKGYGLADVEHATPATADTVFRIGSITKQFAAAAVMRLVAEHKLAVDDELVRYLPTYPTRGQHITLRHLLTHTSGIHDYEHGAWLEEHMAEHRPADELVASFAAQPLDFEPGTKWSYSNSGYFLLGQIVEQVSGKRFDALVDAPGVRWCPDEQDYPHAARGYAVAGDRTRHPAAPFAIQNAGAAGALCATAPALVAWIRKLAAGPYWHDMTTPVTLRNGEHGQYGFGLFVGTFDGNHRVVFHNGGINGFAATLAHFPDDDLTIAILTNTETDAADHLSEAIARAAFGTKAPVVDDLSIAADEGARVAGRYKLDVMDVPLVIIYEDGKLYASPEGATERRRLLRQPDGSYIAEGGDPRIVFAGDTIRVTQANMTFEGKRLP